MNSSSQSDEKDEEDGSDDDDSTSDFGSLEVSYTHLEEATPPQSANFAYTVTSTDSQNRR